MLNIVCLKWGVKYGPDYVNKLYESVKRNTTANFRFHCFTDDETGVNKDVVIHDLPYKDDLEGWWNKVYLFSDLIDIPVGETIFYIDLDSIITDDIDDLLYHRSKTMVVLRDFYWGLAKTAGPMGSGLMMWEHGLYTYVWDNFIKDPADAIKKVFPHGDQHWVNINVKNRLHWQDLFPNRVVSFKVHCRKGLPKETGIVCFHGVPSIPGAATTAGKSWKMYWTPSPWIFKYWKE